MSRYTVRHTVRVAGTKRTFKAFVRAEYALNTSSHADAFDTMDKAERAADDVADRYRAAGHTVLVTDIFDRSREA
jgi:hypothetical protein